MSDSNTDLLCGRDILPDMSSGHDSDVDSSQSVCSSSDTHSGHTSISGLTDRTARLTPSAALNSLTSTAECTNTSLVMADSSSKFSNILAASSSNRIILLPWTSIKERTQQSVNPAADADIRPGEFVMRILFADFTVIAERRIESVLTEPVEKPLSKSLQRGEDSQFDQLLSSFGSVAEHCLPSLLRALFSWYERQMSEVSATEQKKIDQKAKSIIYIVSGSAPETVERSEADIQQERRDLAVEFLFCLVLIEVLKQLSFHPGHEDLVQFIENLSFKHFKYREGSQTGPNAANIHIIADLYAEVIGALAQSRFLLVRKRFMAELKELRSKEPSTNTSQSIISLLMGMKFFRVKMVPIEEFEASFQFMQECAQYFLEVKDKDVKHALAGLFVEILVPVAATVKNEVNIPCLKNFVEMLYSQTLDASTKSKHRLALFPLVTCLLCVSQKSFFLQTWHSFLAMCLSHLKNRDPKMCRVALESLYRLLWVYMIRIKCESNSATQSRLQSIVNSLFPKGSKAVVPRDTPLNIFVKIIQFIAQERLDFAMREIVFDLLSVGRPIKIILTPERMSIGLRAFLVVADSLQQKDGEPPMPRSMGVMPSGNTLRVRKTFLNKMLTDDTAKSIGMSAYFPHVRRVFVDILRALDSQYGRPLMMTSTQNVNKEPDEMITGERKPKIDLFRTCVAAVPRLIPDGMTGAELVDLLARLTVHMDEELRGLAYQSLQTLVIDFPDWRQDVVWGFTQFLSRDVLDTFPQLIDNGLRMLLQLLAAWKNTLICSTFVTNSGLHLGKGMNAGEHTKSVLRDLGNNKKPDSQKSEPLCSVLHLVEAYALTMLCNIRLSPRKLSVHILKETKILLKTLNCSEDEPVIDVIDRYCPQVLEKCLPHLPAAEKSAAQAAVVIDLQWIADRSACIWTSGLHEDGNVKNGSSFNINLVDPWSICLFGFLEKDRLLSVCPTVISHTWPVIFNRVNTLFPIIDPTPVSDNRASLLRSSITVRKPINERDIYIHLWKNYITFAFRVVPSVPNPIIRCASPDLSLSLMENIVETSDLSTSLENLVQAQGLVSSGRFTLPLSAIRKQPKRTSSSPDSLSAERSDNKTPGANISPLALYKLVVPLLRCEVVDVRDTTVLALGKVNSDALKDLMEELLGYIREAVDRKQENVRRRRRRDALRLQLIRVLELIAEYGTFGNSLCVLDRDTQSLHPTFVEYMDGARLYLESEPDKHSTAVKEITLHFCNFIRKMIKSFTLETCQTLLKRDLRKNLFLLFSTWAGRYGSLVRGINIVDLDQSHKKSTELQLAALQAMSALLCCGSCFDAQGLAEDSRFYQWLDVMLESSEDKVSNLGRETVILLLECNPDIGHLLDWVVDRCFTGTQAVADGCFLGLATIFSAREYPCDHYTAVINVTLLNTGCPRPIVRDTALQLLQLLDKRFFGSIGPLAEGDLAEGDQGRSTLDTLLATTYCRSQLHLSEQLAKLHPELTMPMFSEITHRFQTARPEVRQILLQYLLPWLHNMELVDPNVSPTNPAFYYQFYANANDTNRSGGRREGWGSAEATEMVLNNIYYITAKFGDNHPKEMEAVWATLCTSWPNNMKVIIRYLIIVSGMAPNELLPYAKRVILYLARVQPARLLDEMMIELQTVETLNCLIERTETPPFYRLTVMRKASSHSDGTGCPGGAADNNSRSDLGVEKGTIHTKRHSGEDPLKSSVSSKTDSTIKGMSDFISPRLDKIRALVGPNLSEDLSTPTTDTDMQAADDMFSIIRPLGACDKFDIPQPHPLPMPEYGGYFAPLTEYLPESSQPISGFHRCNVAVMLLCDVVVDGLDLDWTVHVPLMLHIIFLGLDHTRSLVYQHCKQLLLNLLIVLAQHNDHLIVSHTILNSKTNLLGLGLITPTLPVPQHIFTENDPAFDLYLYGPGQIPTNGESIVVATKETEPSAIKQAIVAESVPGEKSKEAIVPPVIVTPEESASWTSSEPSLNLSISDIIKSLIHFLATRQNQPLWNYEDITAKVWIVKSAEQMDIFLQHILRVFRESLPNAHVNERWAQTALQLGLSCSSRHYAGRSLQIYRSLRVPITSRMLSDILSRLVETVAEQGEDMQGYVTELLLTLEAAVDSLESDFRPLDLMKDFFKSTPNLNNKELISKRTMYGNVAVSDAVPSLSYLNQTGHMRSTSYSVSYGHRKSSGSPASDTKDLRGRINTEIEKTKFGSNLSRSRSAQSLKLLSDSATQDDKLTILAQLFWLSVSLLESDYEHEFLLALRLLARVLHRLPLDRPDARDKVEKLQTQLRWSSFPGVHSLLLKGCTHANIYEPVVAILSQFTPLLDLLVVDPSQSIAFPMNVMALLPYMLLNYEDANELCIRSADNIFQVSVEKSKKLENLGTVMNLYSRRTFSKESFQWTKCVVKYLHDTYAHLSVNMLAFLIEVLEKGPSNLQLPILNIIHCVLHYVDLASAPAHPINADLLKVISKYIEGVNWKEALKILKLVVTRSSTLGAPPSVQHTYWEGSIASLPHPSFSDYDVFARKELPGRTMEFTYDLSQTPVIGRRLTGKKDDFNSSSKPVASPRRSCSLSPADTAPLSGWKRPWISQGRVRECLVNLLTACGQRVGLPKSPSVIFSQSSDLMERQSSMASSTEEVSVANNDFSGGSRRDDTTTDFGVFKDFDFLEYESESIEGESTDNFNWGVRRRPLSDGEEEMLSVKQHEESISEKTPILTVRKRVATEESSDDDIGSESPLDEIAVAPEFENSSAGASAGFPPSSLSLEEHRLRRDSSTRSDTSGSSAGDLGDVTPCNASPNLTSLIHIRPAIRNDAVEFWNSYVQNTISHTPANTLQLFHQLNRLIRNISTATITTTRESCMYLLQSASSGLPTIKLISSRLNSMIDVIKHRLLIVHIVWFNSSLVNNTKLTETLRYGMLEVQEHLETFCDKKDQTTMYSDAVKTSLKLELLSGQQSDPRNEEYLLDLGKSLYKLHFQLLLLVEAANKMTSTLITTLKNCQFKDITSEILLVRSGLGRAIEDTEADGGTPTPVSSAAPSPAPANAEDLEVSLQELINNEKWSAAISYIKHHRNQLSRDIDLDGSDDVSLILNIYSRKIVQDKPDCYVITNQDNDLADIFGRLFQVSAAVSDLESIMKDRDQSDASLTSQTKD